MSENVNKFIDSLQKGDNAEAGENFKAALRDKVAQSLDKARVDVASKIFNGVPEAEPHSDPKPAVTDPNPETAVVVDTQGNEVEFTDNGNEQPQPTAEVPEAPVNDESQPTT